MNAYDKLYTNMKNRFTVVNDNSEYTLGDYMLMKAGIKKENTSILPAMRNSSNQTAITAFFSYISDKLTVKEPPVRDKTIRKFPLRTSAAALLSAVVACTLFISYGTVTMRSVKNTAPASIDAGITEYRNEENLENSYQ